MPVLFFFYCTLFQVLNLPLGLLYSIMFVTANDLKLKLNAAQFEMRQTAFAKKSICIFFFFSPSAERFRRKPTSAEIFMDDCAGKNPGRSLLGPFLQLTVVVVRPNALPPAERNDNQLISVYAASVIWNV